MLKELKILGVELKLSQATAGHDDAIGTLDEVQTFAFADKILQLNGQPQRFFMHKGQQQMVRLA